MISRDSVQTLIGGTAYTNGGEKIGSIGQVYLDNASGQPAWVTVKTGLFGSNESFVPLDQAELADDGVRVPYDKDRVKGAPNIETDRELSEEEEDRLYAYYGLTHGGTSGEYATGTTGTTTTTTTTSDYAAGTTAGTTGYAAGTTGTRGTVGHDTSGPTTDDAMTLSEERVQVGVQKVQTGRARLRKYIVTEHEQVPVTVTREQVRLEREPITDANYDRAMSGPDLSEEEHEVVLTEERPVVSKETVPVERVRLDKEVVQEQQTVGVDVRREEVELQGDQGVAGTGTTTTGTTTGTTGAAGESLADKARNLADKAKDKLT